ncbi:putative ribosome biogenesis protein [Clavispora lusitaniae]|uniref:Ribosome biogenesis protein SLX9 n=1 Tax=Clavispora lusitaniae TaxID=36911 RepID=A0AA91PXH5_CLALS|nr:putative ribosome biogenesis protein [Clavispora lusitaniae]
MSAKRSTISSKIAEFKKEQEQSDDYHENPLLKLSKTTKKEKQQAKSSQFNEKILSKLTFNLSGGISKSALRRRKRKEKEQLKPKLGDLWSSLPESTVNIVQKNNEREPSYVQHTTKAANLPNPQKQTGHAKLLKTENEHFNKVLQNQEFKCTPFSALKQAISQNMKK